MVFIEERKKYMQSLTNKPKQKALSAFLFDEAYQTPFDNISETDEIYYESIHAIMNNNKEEFKYQYKRISKREVSNESYAPFLHDDFLIFILIIGVIKFGCNKEWLLNVVDKRKKASTTKSFKNLLTGNYLSKDNNQSLILTCLDYFDKSIIGDKLLIGTYQFIIDDQQSSGDDFIRIINYKSFDLILFYKQMIDNNKYSHLLDFEKMFLKRIKIFSTIIYNSFLILLILFMYFILQVVSEAWKIKINDFNLILSLFGLSLLSNALPKWRKIITKFIKSQLGYK